MEKSVSTNKMLRTEVEVGDMISHLPDSLLLHVLSFLPTKEAIATSLLSKRWRPLWISLSTLDLNRRDFQRLKFFHQFVDRVLKFVDLKCVKRFVLRLGYYEKHEYFRPWKISKLINAVMCNKVEHLELHLTPRKGDYELPSSVFTANNIKVLKLSGVRDHWRFESGVMVGALSHVKLPLLEVLDLDAIKFSDFRSFGMLLSACASLKHLVLKNLYGNLNVPLDVGRFNHLVTADVPQSLLPLKVISNVTLLRIDMHYLSPCPDLPTFPNLTYLESRSSFHDWETIFKYLHSCPKLEILMIGQFICSESLEPTADVPHCVSSNLMEFHLGCYQGKQCEFELATFIMKNAMVMRTISITRDHWSRATWKSPNLKRISKCPISSMNCKLLLK